MAKRSGNKREESVVVAIDKDKASQYALKWAVDNLLGKGQALTLLHVKTKSSSSMPSSSLNPFSCFSIFHESSSKTVLHFVVVHSESWS